MLHPGIQDYIFKATFGAFTPLPVGRDDLVDCSGQNRLAGAFLHSTNYMSRN